MSDFKAKMHQIRFRLGFCPGPRCGSLQRSPAPLAGFKGPPTSKGREVRGREGRRGEGREGKEEGEEKEGEMEGRDLDPLVTQTQLRRCKFLQITCGLRYKRWYYLAAGLTLRRCDGKLYHIISPFVIRPMWFFAALKFQFVSCF